MATKISTKVEHKSEYLWCIKNPRITEKSTKLAEANVYTFEVHKDANKQEIQHAVENLYGVIPLKIRIVTGKTEVAFKRNKKGRARTPKKAYVYLKKGDSIKLF